MPDALTWLQLGLSAVLAGVIVERGRYLLLLAPISPEGLRFVLAALEQARPAEACLWAQAAPRTHVGQLLHAGLVARGEGRRRRIADVAVRAIDDEFGRPSAVTARHDRLARGECLDGDKAIILLERREDYRAAARIVFQHLLVVDAAEEEDPVSQAKTSDARLQPRSVFPLTRDHCTDASCFLRGERIDQQTGPF